MEINFANKKIIIISGVIITLITGLIVLSGSFRNQITATDKIAVTKVHLELESISKADLVKRSDIILLGTVENIISKKINSKIRKGEIDIVSDAHILIKKFIKNSINYQQSDVIVRLLGGEIDNEKMIVTDIPFLTRGEELILFLKRGEGNVLLTEEEKNIFVIVAWGQGKYKINTNGRIGAGIEKDFLGRIFNKQEFITEELIREIEKIN